MTPPSLLMTDADHFKAYNDTRVHQAGGPVLVEIAICISDAVKRAGDCAARHDGEEFAVLLPPVRQCRRQGALRSQGRGPQLLRDGEDAGGFACRLNQGACTGATTRTVAGYWLV